jgi:hypothetical protein
MHSSWLTAFPLISGDCLLGGLISLALIPDCYNDLTVITQYSSASDGHFPDFLSAPLRMAQLRSNAARRRIWMYPLRPLGQASVSPTVCQ